MIRESLADLVRDPRHARRGNTVLVGAVSILLVMAVFVAGVALPQLWYVLRTEAYAAEFHNAGGLRAGDTVLISGVPSGRVDSLSMEDGLAVVGFRLTGGRASGRRAPRRSASSRSSVTGSSRWSRRAPATSVPSASSGWSAPRRRT